MDLTTQIVDAINGWLRWAATQLLSPALSAIGGLLFATPSFDRIPEVIRGPHEFSNPEVRRLTGRDFAGQSEVLPGSAGPALAAARG